MKQLVDNAPTKIQPVHGFSQSFAGKLVLLG
jgi:hypothetical protein